MNTIDAPWVIAHVTDAAVRALIPAAAAGLLLILFRVRHANLRLAVWTRVLYAALAMPLLGLFLPSIPVRVPARFLAIASFARQATVASPVAQISPVKPTSPHTKQVVLTDWRPAASLRSERAAIRVPARPAFADWGARVASLTAAEIAMGVYLLVSLLMLGRLALGTLLAQRLRRTGRRIEDPRASRWLEWHTLAMGVERPLPLLESAAVTVPLTVGAWRPAILLPSGWREWESAKLSAVIAHELSHISRNDSRTKALALIYRSIFWFSPLSWWLESHLGALGEQASDLAAIGAGAEPGYYAEVLMSFFKALQTSGARICREGLAMARTGARFGSREGRAQERIEQVLSASATPHGRKARTVALLTVAALPLAYLAAVTRPVLVANPAPAQAQAPMPPEAPPPSAVAPVPQVPPLPPAPAVARAPRATFAGVAPPAPLAAPAPPPPFALSGQEPEPPEAPEPPQGGDGDWMINNGYDGVSFAVVSGKSVIMNGANDDADTVRDLRDKFGGNFIWFRHDGNSYVIRDAAIVSNARGLYAGMDELSRQQDELGRQQDELGRKQDALGKQQDEVRVKVPAELAARLKRVEDEIRQLGPDATQDDLGRLQGELGDIQGYIGDLQGKAGDAQGDLGRRQGELGKQQGELGRKQGELGRRQGEIAREAARKMQGVLKQALANGKAQRIQ